jgi:hypothetical protein
MADTETTRMVALTSLDGQRFGVPEKVAAVSNFVRTTLEGTARPAKTRIRNRVALTNVWLGTRCVSAGFGV